MTDQSLSFKPISIEQDAEVLTRPSRSYWEDAWYRLCQNRRALASLFIVIFMVLFAIAGPWVWTKDPAVQNLDQTSVPPWANRAYEIAEPYTPMVSPPPARTSTATNQIDEITVLGEATSIFVRLQWSIVPNASGYQIYRNIVETLPEYPPGVPLAKIRGANETFYEDRLDLRPRTYWYSIVPIDDDGEELGPLSTLEVDVAPSTTIDDAEKRGWLDPDKTYQPGDTVYSPFAPLGTDYLGRDLLARLMYGARVSLFIGVIAPFLFVVMGILYGSIAGFIGGNLDAVLMRFADFVVALPFLLFMILFKLAFGVDSESSGIIAMLIALVLLSWPATARLVRGQILQIREEGYVSASRLLGTPTHWLIARHMIPNTLGVILVTFTFAVPSTIFTEAFLSFIGMGVEPPTPSWGSMCNDGRKTMETTPHELIFPAIFISITVLAFNILGDGLRDALDARMRAAE